MVGVDDVRLSPITRDVSLIGKVVANQSGPISSNISGRVQTVLVRAGDVVKIDTHVDKVKGQDLNPGTVLNCYWSDKQGRIMLNETNNSGGA